MRNPPQHAVSRQPRTGKAAPPNLLLSSPEVKRKDQRLTDPGRASFADMIELRKTVMVERPMAQVYAYLSDPDNIPKYVGPVHRIHRMTTEKLELGTRLSVEAHFLGIRVNNHAERTHHEPPPRLQTLSVVGRFY